VNLEGGRVPVTIITGFLGSGKTTLLNHLISTSDKRICVVQNEFGSVPVDDIFVSNSSSFATVVSTSSGCMCCKVNGDMVLAFKDLSESKQKFDSVIIETSGLSEVTPVAQSFFADPFLLDNFYLDAIVTVSSDLFDENELTVEQLSLADIILVNKVDLLEDVGKRIEQLVEINPAATVISCTRGNVDPKLVLDIKSFSVTKVLDLKSSTIHRHHEYGSVCLERSEDIDELAFTDWLEEMLREGTCYRCKGVVCFAKVETPASVQCVKQHIEIDYLENYHPLNRKSTLVFIGQKLNRDRLEKSFGALC